MGTALGYEDERPPHPVFVDQFELGVCPVTRAEYERFVDATRHDPPRDWSHPPQPRIYVIRCWAHGDRFAANAHRSRHWTGR